MASDVRTLESCMHFPADGWDERMPKEKKRWWVFFWIYNLVMALIALAWFWVMPHHEIGVKNVAVTPEAFDGMVKDFIQKYETAPGSGIVAVPPGEDAYIAGRMWQWYPTLELKAGQKYTIWVSSVDVTHSLVMPGGKFFVTDAVPGHLYGIDVTPEEPGNYLIYCAEYCGVGHQDMAGRLVVVP